MPTRREQEELWNTIYARLSPEKRRVWDDSGKRNAERTSQNLEWVEELQDLASTIAGQTSVPWPLFDMFWIRLHGVFKELPGQYALARDAEKDPSLKPGHTLLYAHAILVAIDGVLAALSEEEVVVADYYRQRSAHLRQDAYSIRWLPKQKTVHDRRGIEYISKDFKVEEVDRMRASLIALHTNEQGLALHFASTLAAPIGRLADAVRALHSLPPR